MVLEKIDIHDSEENYKKSLKRLNEEKGISKKNKKLINDFLKDSAIGRIPTLKKQQVNVRARMKNLYLLKVVVKYFKKDLDTITEKDVEKLIRDMNDNKIHTYNDKKFSEKTKSNIKRQFIIFLRWLHKSSKKYHDLTDWIDCRYKRKEKPFLKEEEVEMLMKRANTLKQKLIVAFLFDAGCRAEEFLNIRIGDLTKVESDMPYYKVNLREEFSKTRGRTLGLFWRYTTPLIDAWLDEHPDKSKLDSQFFPSTYDGIRVMIDRLGQRVLKKHLTPHLLRHSSATYYASRLNRQQLCIRYGWSFSSNMVDVYIQRAGVDDERIADDVKKERYSELLDHMSKIEEQNKSLKEADKLFAEKIIQFIDVFKKNKNVTRLIAKSDMDKLKEIFD